MAVSMQDWKTIAAVSIALAFGTGGLAAAEHGAHRHEHASAPAGPALNEGQKWATDEALRKGMDNIRQAMEAALHPIHEGKLSNAGYATLAGKLNKELGGIVANCKLDAKADAQLHLVIAELGEGIEAMEGKARKVKRQAGALQVIGALEQYGSHFEHPGWQAIAH